MLDRKDFILREIERIGFILARLRDRILGRTVSGVELRRELHAAAGSLGIDLELAHQVTPATLLLLASPAVDPSKCWFFAECFFLEGLEAQLAGQRDDAEDLLNRARFFYEALSPGTNLLIDLPDARARISEIDALLHADQSA